MNKKLLTCLLACILAAALSLSASAGYTFGRGCESDAEPGYAAISDLYNQIYQVYGIDAYMVSAPELAGEGSAQTFASQYATLLPDSDWILYVRTEDDSILCTNGVCTDIFTADMVRRVNDACVARGDDTVMTAMEFFAGVARELRDYVMGDEASAVVPDDEPQTQTDEPASEDVAVQEDGAAVSQDDPTTEAAVGATEPAKAKSPVKSVVICLVIGLVIALIATLSVKSGYKPVRRRRDAAEYLVDGSLNVTASSETLVRTETSERTIENKSSSAD